MHDADVAFGAATFILAKSENRELGKQPEHSPQRTDSATPETSEYAIGDYNNGKEKADTENGMEMNYPEIKQHRADQVSATGQLLRLDQGLIRW